MSRSAGPAHALTAAWAERVREIVPSEEFEVTTAREVMNIRGKGRLRGFSCVSLPALNLRVGHSIEEQLKVTFQEEGKKLQDLLTKLNRAPWPASGAEPYARVTSEFITIWWGGPAENEAIICTKPISRAEVGV